MLMLKASAHTAMLAIRADTLFIVVSPVKNLQYALRRNLRTRGMNARLLPRPGLA
jgi:hypothetical protein